MARQRVPVQVNQFVGGFNTEANPLSFPISDTSDELNMTLLRNGTRRRRKGVDFESSTKAPTTTTVAGTVNTLELNHFIWEQPAGLAEESLLVTQIGDTILFHDLNGDFLTDSQVGIVNVNTNSPASFAATDTNLIIVSGDTTVYEATYDPDAVGSKVTVAFRTLTTRDFWGVESVQSLESGIKSRPTTLSSEHLYNLRNQSFGYPRMDGRSDVDTFVDPIAVYFAEDARYPSESDSLNPHLFANPNFASNRTAERFNPQDLAANPTANAEAPKGFFIIDLLSRGNSRELQEARLRAQYPDLSLSVTSLPEDRTTGGPTVAQNFAGRVWYSGFVGGLVNGDNRSPQLSSYVFFSQVITRAEQAFRCYQEADPTSNDDSALVDTDGGFILLDGAQNILGMAVLQDSLFIFAENGIWRVSGGDETGFRATSYTVSKVSDQGCVARRSIVLTPTSVAYWAKDGIYALAPNQVGQWSVTNLTDDKIKSFYEDISTAQKQTAFGAYDSTTSKICWIYGSSKSGSRTTELLWLDVRYQAFTKDRVEQQSPDGDGLHTVVMVRRDPFDGTPTNPLREEDGLYFLAITDRTTPVGGFLDATYGFVLFKNDDPTDWPTESGGNVVDAFIQTGPITGGDARLRKDIPYVTVYIEIVDRDSGCFLSSQWDWAVNILSSRYSTPRQAYRLARLDNVGDVAVTKNRIRGRGHAVSLRFESEDDKSLHLYGWEHNLESTTEE